MAQSPRWQKWLDLVTPGSGRYRREDGSVINIADALGYDPAASSRNGRLFRAFWYGQVPAGTTYYFQLAVAPGYDLVGVSRVSTVLDGRLNSTFLVGGSPGAIQDTAQGHNFDERGGGNLAQSNLIRVASLTGAEARTPPMPVIAPGTGAPAGRQPSAQTEAGAQPKFDSDNRPGFTYANPGAEPATLYLQLTWEEWPAY